MGTRESMGISMVLPWFFHGASMRLPWGFRETSKELPWKHTSQYSSTVPGEGG